MVLELKKGRAQGLLVFRVDRLGRNAREASFFIEDLRNRRIALISIHESFDTSTAIGRGILEIIFVLNSWRGSRYPRPPNCGWRRPGQRARSWVGPPYPVIRGDALKN